MYTLANHKAAKAEFDSLNNRFTNNSGNNPNKYRASINASSIALRTIEAELKASGLLERTPHEEVEHQLESEFPNARSKQAVEFQGMRYVRRFLPVGKSLSGKSVTEWSKYWEEVQL